jgi:hypothetical protein
MDTLRPIPTPLRTRWREFRLRYLPAAAFGAMVIVIALLWQNHVNPPSVLAEVEPVVARVMSPVSGTLVRLDVTRLQRVACGQVIGIVEIAEDRLRGSPRSIPLHSPIDGTVSALSNRIGEVVLAGNPILVVTGQESSNILAYARLPLDVTPKRGDWVQVRKKTRKQPAALARILQVGTQLEPIDPVLLNNGNGRFCQELGLPFLVSVPKSLNLTPGERVDLMLNPREKPVQN